MGVLAMSTTSREVVGTKDSGGGLGGYEQNQCLDSDASWSGNEGWPCWVRMAHGAQASQEGRTSQAGVLTVIPRAGPWKSAPTKQSRRAASILSCDYMTFGLGCMAYLNCPTGPSIAVGRASLLYVCTRGVPRTT